MQSEWDSINEKVYYNVTQTESLFPDDALSYNESLSKLRATSEYLIKNNFIAAAAQQAMDTAVVGGNVTIRFEGTKRLQEDVQKAWEKRENSLDINRESNITTIFSEIVMESFAHGDILINLPVDKTGRIYIELIDAARVRTPMEERNNPLIREGVEYFASGSIKGYWVVKGTKRKFSYVSLTKTNFIFLPKYKTSGEFTRKVCYLFKSPFRLRQSASRQYPPLSPGISLLKYFSQYLEAVLIGARIAACHVLGIETSNPATAKKEISGESRTGSNDKRVSKIQPGMVYYFRKGEKITSHSPKTPSATSDPLVLRLCKFVSMLIRIPYELFFLDLGEVTYSSWKGGTMDVKRNILKWRNSLTSAGKWLVNAFLLEAINNGEIKSSLRKIKIFIRFPLYASLDEEKTSRANNLDLDNETASRQRITEEGSHNFKLLEKELTEEMILEINREAEGLILKKKLEKENDIIFPSTEKNDRDTVSGEETDKTEEEKRERRKEDGNW